MRRSSSSMIYWYIPNFTPNIFQQFIAIIKGRITSELTQATSVLWMYMDYNLPSVASFREMRPRVHNKDIAWVASEVIRPPDDGNELLG
jgi:hypothetical protein